MHRPLHRPEYQRRLPKTHLRLGGMDVHIHQLGRHIDEQHDHRIAPGHQQGVVGLHHCEGQIAVLNVAAVDEKLDVTAIGPMQGRSAHETAHAHIGCDRIARGVHGKHLARYLRAIDLNQRGHAVPCAGRLETETPLSHIAEAHFGISQRVAGDDFANMACLGSVGFEELLARGRVPEKLRHSDIRAGRCAYGPLADNLAPLQLQLHPHGLLSRPGDEGDLAHRADRGQGLAPKPQRGDMLQLLGRADLRGGVTLEGQGRFGRGDAAAIVNDANEPFAAIRNLHANVGGSRVQAVLDELFHHGRGPFHDLARCDLIGYIRRKNLDGHGSIINRRPCLEKKPDDSMH